MTSFPGSPSVRKARSSGSIRSTRWPASSSSSTTPTRSRGRLTAQHGGGAPSAGRGAATDRAASRRRFRSRSRSTPPTSSRQADAMAVDDRASTRRWPPWRCSCTRSRRSSSPTRCWPALGVIEVIPPEAPLTLFVWGPKRVVPVKHHRLHDHRGGVRPRRSTRFAPRSALGARRPQLPRPGAAERRRRAVHGPPGRQGSDGHHRRRGQRSPARYPAQSSAQHRLRAEIMFDTTSRYSGLETTGD